MEIFFIFFIWGAALAVLFGAFAYIVAIFFVITEPKEPQSDPGKDNQDIV